MAKYRATKQDRQRRTSKKKTLIVFVRDQWQVPVSRYVCSVLNVTQYSRRLLPF